MGDIVGLFDNPKKDRRKNTQELVDFAKNELEHNQEQIERAINLVAVTTLESDHYSNEEKHQIIIEFTRSIQLLINNIKREVMVDY